MVAPVNTLSRLSRVAFVFVTLVTLGSCGGGSSGPSEPTSLTVQSGANQEGQVGSALPAKVVVLARNTKGPVAGATIAVGVDPQNGGSVAPSQATTAADGTAQFTWTLGTKLGPQTLTVSTTGATPITTTVGATARAAEASIVVAVTEILQFVVVGHAVGIPPSVKVTDAFNNPLAGVVVTFENLQAGSVLTGAQQTTNASGIATVGGWTIGPDALTYQIRARIANGAIALFEARGVPATITAVAGTGQTANVGTALPVTPAVKAARDDGSPLPNVTFTFAIVSGGGSLSGTTAVTGADGIARPTRWVLGLVPGLNQMEAGTFGHPALAFQATGVASPAAFVSATGGTSLTGIFGNYLAGTPQVTVTDASGNPVAGTNITFQVTAGAGSITSPSVTTDFAGHASPTSWRLGASGAQSVTASATGVPPVVFNATGSSAPPGTFRIEIRYAAGTSPTPAQQAAFDFAVARWTQLIRAGGLPYTIKPDEVIADCGSLTGTVDGVIIIANLHGIDGAGGILGRAFNCVLRDEGFLPVTGVMEFDTSDLAGLESNGTLNLVILHEMAHVLGFGTIWNISAPGLGTNAFLSGSATADPTFNGLGARAAFFGSLPLGSTFSGVPVPVEGGFGPGTRLSHWRESSFSTELMTGFLGPGLVNPLSAITVQQFHDLGYVVDDATADNYLFPGLLQAAGVSLHLAEDVPPGLVTVINRKGEVVARIPRIRFYK